MIYEYSDYRAYLKSVLAGRTSENRLYSLRAFAQKLKLANSYLSEVLAGKKPLSTDAALRISIRLGLTEFESQYLCLMVQLDGEKDPEYRSILIERLQSFRAQHKVFDLSSEMFRVIADWYHLAILEMTFLPGVSMEAAAIARRLGITEIEASTAIERLARLDLIEKVDGRWAKTKDYMLAKSDVSDGAFKRFHRQFLEKASEALEAQDPRERVSSTDVLPLDSRRLDEVRALVDQFVSEVIKVSKKSKVKDHVYCLGVHFFSLDTEKK